MQSTDKNKVKWIYKRGRYILIFRRREVPLYAIDYKARKNNIHFIPRGFQLLRYLSCNNITLLCGTKHKTKILHSNHQPIKNNRSFFSMVAQTKAFNTPCSYFYLIPKTSFKKGLVLPAWLTSRETKSQASTSHK